MFVVAPPPRAAVTNAAGKYDDEQLQEGEAYGGSCYEVNVLHQQFVHNLKAAVLVRIVCVARDLVAAGVRQAGAEARGGAGGGPVCAVDDAAALEGVLSPVPGLGDTFVTSLAVVDHARRHVLGDLSLEVVLEKVGRDSSAHLKEEDCNDDGGVGVNHTLVLKQRSAAPKERDNENNNSEDNEENGCVGIAGAKEV